MKHDTANNWAKATGFVPKAGEIIVYDYDENDSFGFQTNTKIGDGKTLLSELPFTNTLTFGHNEWNMQDFISNSPYFKSCEMFDCMESDRLYLHFQINTMYSDNFDIVFWESDFSERRSIQLGLADLNCSINDLYCLSNAKPLFFKREYASL